MSYSQFCPISKASEIICEKWAIIILRELLVGIDTFNGLRNYIPLISPTLLSKRLSEFEDYGLLEKIETGVNKPKYRYQLTDAGKELGPIVMELGEWGNRWAVSNLKKQDYDPQLLMWDIKRGIKVESLPQTARYVVEFNCSGVPRKLSRWWFVIEPKQIPDLCFKDPGYEINLTVSSDIKTLVDTWMGWVPLPKAIKTQKIQLDGPQKEKKIFPQWFALGHFARSAK